MTLFLVLMIGLNMVQANKDIQRCEKSNFKDSGCSIYVKMNVHKAKK